MKTRGKESAAQNFRRGRFHPRSGFHREAQLSPILPVLADVLLMLLVEMINATGMVVGAKFDGKDLQ